MRTTIRIDDQILAEIKQLAAQSGQTMTAIIEEALRQMLAPPISSLNDEDVLALASLKMPVTQNDRLGELQQKGKRESLSESERTELRALLHIYQMGQLRKSEGLAEAVRRGLRAPLSA